MRSFLDKATLLSRITLTQGHYMKFLTEDQLKNTVPSIFSTSHHEKLSSKYEVIPTIETVKSLESAGYYPVMAMETRCRDENNKPYAKHMLRFRQNKLFNVGDNLAEIVLVNSHNGSCSYQLKAGVFRLVCSNGLVVGNENFAFNIRHQGDVNKKVVAAADTIIEVFPQVLDKVEKWKKIPLSIEQQINFAEEAALLRWDKEDLKIDIKSLLTANRYDDFSNSLWVTFNKIQENIIRGGIRYYNRETRTRNTTREVKSVNENIRINTSLWNMTEKLEHLLTS